MRTREIPEIRNRVVRSYARMVVIRQNGVVRKQSYMPTEDLTQQTKTSRLRGLSVDTYQLHLSRS